eukprot:CAMPEP_0117008602 /NCGR_PEP_ID=MMETSP0472-20121206/8053_1 /TAXON_ID=693140 ORGANISM="Tiarina fusus, Strain LIS" /NCGR_SAMPLE_ID=MMETSP0472 /ASSEMBLY_ACC=CAM_ASM_000603 /LENGTH=68 /DNA_ID=CAMNT_0004710677 /DNA_START=92 /DNA_END=298 /DNA_ORIENTATION=-
MDKVKTAADTAFNAGLPKGARGAAWILAIGAVAAYSVYENKDNGQTFSKDEQQKWNKEKTPEGPPGAK